MTVEQLIDSASRKMHECKIIDNSGFGIICCACNRRSSPVLLVVPYFHGCVFCGNCLVKIGQYLNGKTD